MDINLNTICSIILTLSCWWWCCYWC